MREREKAHTPLMFIHQPTEHIPTSFMQSSFSSLHDQALAPIEEQEESSAMIQTDTLVKVETLKEVDRKLEEVDDQPTEKHAHIREKKKRFADLNIEEKIKYCMKTSPYIPPITCAIKTDEKTIVGTIHMYEDGVVHVRTNNSQTNKTVNIAEITHIRIIGF